MESILQSDPGERIQILDADGTVRACQTPPDLSDETLLEMYRYLKLGRRFDQRATSLQRQGRIGTYSPHAGQEAAQVGSAFALEADDWIFPYTRDRVATWVHGVDPATNLLYRVGHPDGHRIPADVNVFPSVVPVGTHLLHATGWAWTWTLDGDEDRATICYFGDGATSEGDFHEGMNFAGVFDVPAVFFCSNNQWAISTPFERQTASETLAQKAAGYGFDGVQVDGMDPLAVYAVTRAALEKAKRPDQGDARPTFLEAVLYRFGAHTTADDASVYRDEAETEEWKALDPIPRFETYLRDTGRLDDETVEAIDTDIEETLAAVVSRAESAPEPHPEVIFEHTYADMPAHLSAQRADLQAFRETYSDEEIMAGEQPWMNLLEE